jgi:predicted DNA-binding mobile mystery protein A
MNRQRAMARALRRKQLDTQLINDSPIILRATPKHGWIREIRDALGMTAEQLATRMKISQSTVARLERNEQRHTITIESLRRAADAMDCQLVYAFVPRKSLEATVEAQARRRAQEIVDSIEHTMLLENQARSPAQVAHAVEWTASALVREGGSNLWRSDDFRDDQ